MKALLAPQKMQYAHEALGFKATIQKQDIQLVYYRNACVWGVGGCVSVCIPAKYH